MGANGEDVRENGRRGETVVRGNVGVKREEAKVRLEIGAEFKEIALAKKDIKAFDSEKEKLLFDIKKNEDLISACSITSEQHAKDTDEDRKETNGLFGDGGLRSARLGGIALKIDRVNEEREKLRENNGFGR